jgi:CSLREA domain-containing protein
VTPIEGFIRRKQMWYLIRMVYSSRARWLPFCLGGIGLLAMLPGWLASAYGAPTTSGTTIAVTTLTDELNEDGDCSLREAVQAANSDQTVDACPAGNGADTITLPAGIYTLHSGGRLEDANATGDLDLLDSLTIAGAGQTQTIIDGAGLDRVFDIIAEQPAAFRITITDITIQHGRIIHEVYDPPFEDEGVVYGGAIRNAASLHVINSTIRNNQADHGGGIFGFVTAPITIENSTIISNTAHSYGGGISTFGALTIRDSTIISNTAGADGGGIHSESSLMMEHTTVNDNLSHGMGGGLAIWGESTIKDSIITGNQALQKILGAGGIGNTGSLLLIDSEVSNNAAGGRQKEDTQVDSSGGGLLNVGIAIVKNTTFRDNTAIHGLGGGILNGTIMEVSGGNVSNNTAINAGGIVNISSATMTISGTTIHQNSAPFAGGGVSNLGTMQIMRSTISENEMTQSADIHAYGGGIYNSGKLDITDSTRIENNISASNAGGIYNAITGTLTISATQVHHNRAAFSGGGIFNDGTMILRYSSVNTNDALIAGGLLNGRVDNHTSLAFIEQSELSNNTSLREGTFFDDNGQEIYLVGSCGGIYNFAGLQITSSTIHQNTALGIGGICNDLVLYIEQSTVSGNNARRTVGGGISNTGILDVDTCVITNNSAQTNGGGIFNARLEYLGALGEATIRNTTIQSNTAKTLSGGGIYNEGELLLSGSTLLHNRAFIGGGLNTRSDATLTNVTVSGNTSFVPEDNLLSNEGMDRRVELGPLASRDVLLSPRLLSSQRREGFGSGALPENHPLQSEPAQDSGTPVGGGIAVDVSGILTMTNVTVSHNTVEASGVGGGIFNNGETSLQNTLIANSTAGGDCGGSPLSSQGNNLAGDESCGLNMATDHNNTSALLHVLQDNGGTTWTHALQPDSPAIDAGNNTQCPDTDQRGRQRPFDGNGDGKSVCDIGAYESHEETQGTPITDDRPRVYLPLVQKNS